LREVAEDLLAASDPEHPDAWLEHSNGWILTATEDGRLRDE